MHGTLATPERRLLALLVALTSVLIGHGLARQACAADSIEELVRRIRPSVVVVRAADRTGQRRGLGSGFVIREDGVVVTNFHVIGRGRAFEIEFANGQRGRPLEILAADEARDLAVLRIDPGGVELPALELGDSGVLVPGQTVAAVGNPLGFEFSAARGVISATDRELGGRRLVQLSMPIEPGSSGSPVVDLEGRVVGVIAIKSGAALGFAIPVNDLRSVIESFRPVPYARWLTIGALDPHEWRTALGGDWRQRAGRLVASGTGDGFGGRMLCLFQPEEPNGDFEAEVEVRLDDESGAAGLAFRADGGDVHYGFYPTAGSLRLTRFEGPTVFEWAILETIPSAHYRPGEWNVIRVHVTGTRISCFVNDSLVIEANDDRLHAGKVGLVKFREPGAQFRRFRLGSELAPRAKPSAEAVERTEEIARWVRRPGLPRPELVGQLLEVEGSVEVLERIARDVDRRGEALRELAAVAHQRRTERALREALSATNSPSSLLRAALLVSRLDNRELEVEVYEELVERMAQRLRPRIEAAPDPSARLDVLIDYFVMERGFHGSTGEYYHRSNSYINEVLDDREGIPITLAVVFIELARRVGFDVGGIGIPRHFIVSCRLPEGEEQLIDVFGGCARIDRSEAELLSGSRLGDEDFVRADDRSIVVRILRNLSGVAERERDSTGVLRYLDAILALVPDSVPDRLNRARLRYLGEQRFTAAEDIDWLLEHEPPGIDLSPLREVRRTLEPMREF